MQYSRVVCIYILFTLEIFSVPKYVLGLPEFLSMNFDVFEFNILLLFKM